MVSQRRDKKGVREWREKNNELQGRVKRVKEIGRSKAGKVEEPEGILKYLVCQGAAGEIREMVGRRSMEKVTEWNRGVKKKGECDGGREEKLENIEIR
ncbi:hypothetical protein MTP99_007770 [Tenebrio molitor]|nr:hypothetical protein MTP99_007770 [Tenebrio molitor]